MSEAVWLAARMNLQVLRDRHPDWTHRAYADALGQSLAWVKKWQRRFRQTPDDPAVCHGRSRARTTITPVYSDAVITAILTIRDTPPARLNRIPGPKTILYYLQQDTSLTDRNVSIPLRQMTTMHSVSNAPGVNRRPDVALPQWM